MSKKFLRNADSLSEEQIKYLRGWSLVSFAPFGVFVFRQWEFIIGMIVYSVLLAANLGTLLSTAIWGLMCAYTMRHGTRYAWNRSKKSFEEFKAKERKWNDIGFGFLIITLAMIIFSLLGGIEAYT